MLGHSFKSRVGYEGDLEEGGKARFALGELMRTADSKPEPAILMQVFDREDAEVVNYALTTNSFWVLLDLMMKCFQHVPPPTAEEVAQVEAMIEKSESNITESACPKSIDGKHLYNGLGVCRFCTDIYDAK